MMDKRTIILILTSIASVATMSLSQETTAKPHVGKNIFTYESIHEPI